MNESRLSRALAFLADTPKSAISTINRQEMQINNKSHKIHNTIYKLQLKYYSSIFDNPVTCLLLYCTHCIIQILHSKKEIWKMSNLTDSCNSVVPGCCGNWKWLAVVVQTKQCII